MKYYIIIRVLIKDVFFLTDGQPNAPPPRGHIPMLQRFQDKHPDCCNINTYGFGYV